MEEIWSRDGESEDDLDIRYRDERDGDETPFSTTSSHEPMCNPIKLEPTNSDDSENIPIASVPKNKDSPLKTYPSEIHFTQAEKTTKFIKTRKTVARKS